MRSRPSSTNHLFDDRLFDELLEAGERIDDHRLHVGDVLQRAVEVVLPVPVAIATKSSRRPSAVPFWTARMAFRW